MSKQTPEQQFPPPQSYPTAPPPAQFSPPPPQQFVSPAEQSALPPQFEPQSQEQPSSFLGQSTDQPAPQAFGTLPQHPEQQIPQQIPRPTNRGFRWTAGRIIALSIGCALIVLIAICTITIVPALSKNATNAVVIDYLEQPAVQALYTSWESEFLELDALIKEPDVTIDQVAAKIERIRSLCNDFLSSPRLSQDHLLFEVDQKLVSGVSDIDTALSQLVYGLQTGDISAVVSSNDLTTQGGQKMLEATELLAEILGVSADDLKQLQD